MKKELNTLELCRAYGIEAHANDDIFATVLTMDTPGHDKVLKELLDKEGDGKQDYLLYKHPAYFWRYVAIIPYGLVSSDDIMNKLIPAIVGRTNTLTPPPSTDH